MKMSTMGSLGNAPYFQKATPEPRSAQKSEAMYTNYSHNFHQLNLYVCCGNIVTPG